MPIPAAQRAEKILLSISHELRSIQLDAYNGQDRTAQAIHKTYQSHAGNLYQKSGLELLNLVGSLAIPYLASRQIASLSATIQDYQLWARNDLMKPTDANKFIKELNSDIQNISENAKQTQEYMGKAVGVASSLMDPSNMKSQTDAQRLQTAQSELGTLHQALQSAIQTHEAALQRLQNVENSTRNA